MSGSGSHARVAPSGPMISARVVTSKARHLVASAVEAAPALGGRARPAVTPDADRPTPAFRNSRRSMMCSPLVVPGFVPEPGDPATAPRGHTQNALTTVLRCSSLRAGSVKSIIGIPVGLPDWSVLCCWHHPFQGEGWEGAVRGRALEGRLCRRNPIFREGGKGGREPLRVP